MWYESLQQMSYSPDILIGDRSSLDKESRAAGNFDPGWANKAQLIALIDTGRRNGIEPAIDTFLCDTPS